MKVITELATAMINSGEDQFAVAAGLMVNALIIYRNALSPEDYTAMLNSMINTKNEVPLVKRVLH